MTKRFRSGFAWIKCFGYSYICEILEENNGLYVIEVGDSIIHDVPECALTEIRGGEV